MDARALRAIWAARLARLYPAYLLAFALAAPFALERWAAGGPLAAANAAAGVLASGAAPYVLLHDGLLVPLFAVAVLALAQGRGVLARALGSAPARALGDASFALYVLQAPLWLWGRRLAGGDGPASPAFVLC